MNIRIIIIISIVVIGIVVAFGMSDTENLVDTVPTQSSPQPSNEENTSKNYTLELRESVGMTASP